jgi:hypothetical protein
MPNLHGSSEREFDFSFPAYQRWKRIALVWAGLLVAALVGFLLAWNVFFKYVPPGQHLIIIAKNGAPLDPGEVLAAEGQKGIRREVMGEGWHLVTPVIYTAEVEDNTLVPPGKIGIVTALGGKPMPKGRVLADEGEQGIQRQVLPPGGYRINKHGFKVDLVDATEIKPGYVGVMRRRLATEGDQGTGILPHALQPGLYYLNTQEFEIIPVEVGIFQTTFLAPEKEGGKNTAITFTSKGGFPISIDCTVEWEVLPQHMPSIVAEYGGRRAVESKVIDVQAHAIGRDKGIDYGVQDFLEGSTREKFQEDFTQELTRVCAEKNVTIHSAFIRRIDIPEEYLKPIRDKQIAIETQLTTKAKEVTADTENQVEREQRTIQQEVAKVEAQTKLLVANIDQEVKNVQVKTEAEIERMKAEYGSKIASLDAERTRLLGQADAEATKMNETAKSSLYQMKMDVFQNDTQAFLRYTLAEQLNPQMTLRLFHSGAGTFWTNMDGKGFNLMFPAPTEPAAKKK